MGIGVLWRVAGKKIHHFMLWILVDSVYLKEGTMTMYGKKIQMGAANFEHVMGLRNAGLTEVFEGLINDHPELMEINNSVCGKVN